jgi:thioredoxin 1
MPSNEQDTQSKIRIEENPLLKVLFRVFAVLSLVGFLTNVSAAEQQFSAAQFTKAVSDGQPVVVWFHASWCPTCRAQQPSVDKLAKSDEMKSVTVFLADFDKEKALKKSLDVSQQSTFVVFRGGHEVARSTGETDEQAIRATWKKAL